jgi:hypothetical protein
MSTAAEVASLVNSVSGLAGRMLDGIAAAFTESVIKKNQNKPN